MATIALTKPARLLPTPRLQPGEDLFGRDMCLITCRACGAGEAVYTDHPALLCGACLIDLSATAYRVSEDYSAAMVAFFDASRALDERTRGNVWYAKTEQARTDMAVTPAVFARAWEAARQEGGEKVALIELRETMDTAAEAMRAAEVRYIAAAPELSAARQAFGQPVEV